MSSPNNSVQTQREDNANPNLPFVITFNRFMSNQVVDGICIFNVLRIDIFKYALLTMQRPGFSGLQRPSVIFIDSCGVSEGGDNGGPRREFFRLGLIELQNGILFDGPECDKQIQWRSCSFAENLYKQAGIFIGMSIIHGGPAPSFFSEAFFDCFVGTKTELKIDGAIETEINRIKEAHTLTELNEVLTRTNTYLTAAGCPTSVTDFAKKERILKGLLHFYATVRNKPALEQFISGFQSLGIYNFIVEHKVEFKKMFCYQKRALQVSDFNETFTFDFSEATLENKTFIFFQRFLTDCEERRIETTLEDAS